MTYTPEMDKTKTKKEKCIVSAKLRNEMWLLVITVRSGVTALPTITHTTLLSDTHKFQGHARGTDNQHHFSALVQTW